MNILQNIYRENDKNSKIVKGFIQHNNIVDQTIIIHSEIQLQAAKHCKSLHIDATGGVVNSFTKGKKMLMINAVLYDSEMENKSLWVITISNCITERERSYDIQVFLNKLIVDYKITTKTDFRPERVVVDFSHAMMNAIVVCFYKSNLKDYMNRRYVNKNIQKPSLQLCKSHVSKAFSVHCKKTTSNLKSAKKQKELMMRVATSWIMSTTQDELDKKWRAACEIFLGINDTVRFQKNYDILFHEELSSYIEADDEGADDQEDHSLDYFEDIESSGSSYRKDTLSGQKCEAIFQNTLLEANKEDEYYNHMWLEKMLTYFMPYSVLWSNINQIATSNAPVENLHRSIKHCYIPEGKIDPAPFIEKCHSIFVPQSTAYVAKKSSMKPTLKVRRNILKKNDPLLSSEKWKKKISKGYKNIKRKYDYYLSKSTNEIKSADMINSLKSTDSSSKRNVHNESKCELESNSNLIPPSSIRSLCPASTPLLPPSPPLLPPLPSSPIDDLLPDISVSAEKCVLNTVKNVNLADDSELEFQLLDNVGLKAKIARKKNHYYSLLKTVFYDDIKENLEKKQTEVTNFSIDCFLLSFKEHHPHSNVVIFKTNEIDKEANDIEFIQVIGTQKRGYHWITLSNVLAPESTVYLYDSLSTLSQKFTLNNHPKDACGKYKNTSCVGFPVMNHQLDSTSCGLYAMIYAAMLFVKMDPINYYVHFNETKLRASIIEFINCKKMGTTVQKWITENVTLINRSRNKIDTIKI